MRKMSKTTPLFKRPNASQVDIKNICVDGYNLSSSEMEDTSKFACVGLSSCVSVPWQKSSPAGSVGIKKHDWV